MGSCNGKECDGLCCIYHERVMLHADEIERFKNARLENHMGKIYLNINGGCEFLDNRKCSIYESKPKECGVYWCGSIQREEIERKSNV